MVDVDEGPSSCSMLPLLNPMCAKTGMCVWVGGGGGTSCTIYLTLVLCNRTDNVQAHDSPFSQGRPSRRTMHSG